MGSGTADQEVLAAVRDLLTTGQLRPGQPVRQGDLAAQLGVSRVPVREALQTLQAIGLLEHLPNRGYVVASLTFAEIEELYRLRQIIETDAIRQGFAGGPSQQMIWKMRRAHEQERLASTADIVLSNRLNREFHFPLFEASTRLQQRLIAQMWDSTDPYRILYYAHGGILSRSLDEHAEILAATEAGDLDRVIQLSDEHRYHGVKELARIM